MVVLITILILIAIFGVPTLLCCKLAAKIQKDRKKFKLNQYTQEEYEKLERKVYKLSKSSDLFNKIWKIICLPLMLYSLIYFFIIAIIDFTINSKNMSINYRMSENLFNFCLRTSIILLILLTVIGIFYVISYKRLEINMYILGIEFTEMTNHERVVNHNYNLVENNISTIKGKYKIKELKYKYFIIFDLIFITFTIIVGIILL